MSATARRLRPARLGALLVAAALLGAPLAAWPRPPRAAAQEGAAPPVSVTLLRLDPRAPQPHDRITVSVRLRNTGTETVNRLRVYLERSASPITNRSQLAAYAAQDGYIGPPLDTATGGPAEDSLAAGRGTDVTLSVPVDDLHLGATAAIYGFGVEVQGRTDTLGFGTVGRLRTFLPWAPQGSIARPTRLAWVWPLVDRPRRSSSRTFRDDALARELAPDGRLEGLLSAATAPGAAPVTYAVDPLLLEDLTFMAGGYRVRVGTHTVAGTGAGRAKDFLSTLRSAVRTGEMVSLPYADVDVDALVRNGLAGDVSNALNAGRQVTSSVLGLPTGALPSIVWPSGSDVSAEALRALFAADVPAVVLRDDAVPTADSVPFTPTGHTTIALPAGTIDAVLTDHVLDDVVTAGASGPFAGRLAEQRFLAETLLVTEELPNRQRAVVVAPSRRWAPPPHYAAVLLQDTGSVPWLEAATVDDVRATPPDTTERGALQVLPRVRAGELPAGYLATVAGIRHRTDQLESMFVKPELEFARQLYYGGFRMESSAWHGQPVEGRALRDEVAAAVDDARHKVYIVTSGLVTLTSSSGSVPITVANKLAQDVRVVLRLDPGGHARVQGAGVLQLLPAGLFKTFTVHLEAQTSGVFRLQAALYTPGQEPEQFGRPSTLFVRSTAYGTLVLGITGGAFAVLLVAVAVRLARRGRQARRSAEEGRT